MSRVANGGKVNMGGLMEDKDQSVVCYIESFGADRGGGLLFIFCTVQSYFQADGGWAQRTFLVPASSQLPSLQNIPYAKMAYFRVADFVILQGEWLNFKPTLKYI